MYVPFLKISEGNKSFILTSEYSEMTNQTTLTVKSLLDIKKTEIKQSLSLNDLLEIKTFIENTINETGYNE